MDDDTVNRCACGCGGVTNRSRSGSPRRFRHGHNRRGTGSPEGWLEQGMRFVRVDGKKRPLHRLLVEERLGRKLRADEIAISTVTRSTTTKRTCSSSAGGSTSSAR